MQELMLTQVLYIKCVLRLNAIGYHKNLYTYKLYLLIKKIIISNLQMFSKENTTLLDANQHIKSITYNNTVISCS